MNTLNQRLVRSRSDRMIAGVAGGIGHYLNIDPVLVRLAFVALVFSGIGLPAYAILWLLMPEEPAGAPHPPAEGVTQVFVAPEAASRAPRFDPMTGAPLEPEQEIPVQNLGGTPGQQAANGRNRTLGLILIALGAFLTIKLLLPGLLPLLLPALLIGAGIMLLRRGR